MKKPKTCYKLKNWRAYNEALVDRGSLTLWFEDAQIERWHRSGYRGSPMIYSDMAVQCGLPIRELFQLPLQSTEGFLRSLVKLLGVPLQVPDYSILCRRQQTLSVALPRPVAQKPRHLTGDSTELKYIKPFRTKRLSALTISCGNSLANCSINYMPMNAGIFSGIQVMFLRNR
jgi:hypothetical protein